MAAQLRAKAVANLALRRHVLHVDPARIAAFRSSYRASSDAAEIGAAARGASADIARRFAAVAETEGKSRGALVSQIRTLQADRDALYRSIVVQVLREARAIAGARRLDGLEVSTARPRGSVDLTPAVRTALADR
jgi:hypothetical protein